MIKMKEKTCCLEQLYLVPGEYKWDTLIEPVSKSSGIFYNPGHVGAYIILQIHCLAFLRCHS